MLAVQHRDLGLDPQHPGDNPGLGTLSPDPSTGVGMRAQRPADPELVSSLAEIVTVGFREKLCPQI